MSKGTINPTIEQAMSLSQVSTRMLMELYLNKSLMPSNVDLIFAEQAFIHTELIDENYYYVLKFVANDTEDIIIKGKNYRATMLKRGDLETSQDASIEKISMTMTNKDLGFASSLAKIGRYLNYQNVKLLDYFCDFPNEPPTYFFGGKVDNLKMTVSEFTFDIKRILGSFSEDAPRFTYDPNCQWTFGDNMCKHRVERDENCDKTLQSCIGFDNVFNFGGHPSIPKERVIR